MKCLVGSTGFVGGALTRQARFDKTYSSRDISDIHGADVDVLYCAGAPGQKWLANKDGEADRANLENLARHLEQARISHLVLLSTIDVFERPRGIYEDGLEPRFSVEPYGANRRWLEQAARSLANKLTVIRLPALVGLGLRKNALYDLQHNNLQSNFNARSCFQFYPVEKLHEDISRIIQFEVPLVHFATEPVEIGEVADTIFNLQPQSGGSEPAHYDFRTRHAGLFDGEGGYMYNRKEVLNHIQKYHREEPIRLQLKQ